jgi:hypothetical protein
MANSPFPADYVEILSRLKKQVKKEAPVQSKQARQYPLHTKRADNVMVWLCANVIGDSQPTQLAIES